MQVKPLTPKQRKVYDFIVSFRKEHKYSPTYKEISAALGFETKCGCVTHINALQSKGWITREPKARTILPTQEGRK